MPDQEYSVKQPISHNNKSYKIGSSITLSDEQAEELKALGAIEGGKEVETATIKADGGKNLSPDESKELADATEAGIVQSSSREEELNTLFATQGWRAIAKIAEPLGIQKPEGGWDDAIPIIVQKEQEAQQG